MNSKINLRLLAILTGGLIFNFVFWNEELGLNLVIFSTFTFIALLAIDVKILQNRKWLLASLAHLLTCVEVVYNNMPFSILAYYATFFVMLAFAHLEQVKTVMVAGSSAILQLLAAPISLFQALTNFKVGQFSLKPLFRTLKFWLIPTILLFVFGALYAQANETFKTSFSKIAELIESVSHFISENIFADLTFGRLIFFCVGILFSTGILLKLRANLIEHIDQNGTDDLIRKRRHNRNRNVLKDLIWTFTGDLLDKKLALKTESTIGIICFASLNLLLFLLNVMELTAVFTTQSRNFAGDLHEGTGILIFSIVLALLVILFFFNGNLNFYSRNQKIKILAMTWIFQNAVLVLMVIHKDWIYVDALGLTEKRIGVFLFALVSGIGLITVLIKVWKLKTFYYLVKVNSFAWLTLLIIGGFFHWEQIIFDFNFKNSNQTNIDYYHTTALSNHVLISIYENRGVLAQALRKNQTASKPLTNSENPNLILKRELNDRINRFMTYQETLSNLSWNYDDWRTYHYFKAKNWKTDADTGL